MTTISLNLSDDESALINSYVTAKNLNLSSFIKELVLTKIEEDFEPDENRVAAARARLKSEKIYAQDEVWKMLGV